MGVQNFIPEIWSTKILKEKDKEAMLVKNCSREFTGVISGVGSKVKINSINTPTIGTYTPNSTTITPEQLKDESRMVEVTEAKYFAIFLDQVDEAQATGGLLEEAMRKGSIGLNDSAEAFVAGKYADAANTLTVTGFTTAKVFSTFMKAKRLLMKNNVSSNEMFAEVTPEIYERMVLADIVKNTQDNGDTIRKGEFSKMLGMMVYVSNNLTVTTTDENISVSTCAVRTKDSIGFVEQVSDVVKYIPDGSFGQAVKALYLYGAGTIKPKEMVKLVITTAAETTI